MSLLYRSLRTMGMAPGAPEKKQDRLRIGVLGAANIAPMALINPCKYNADAEVVAVAARDVERARKFASSYKIPKVYDSYEALLLDKEIDAVYIPSPNGLHYKWVIKSLEAGKHVLCEKPITANAEEAEELVEASIKHKRVLMDASHSFHHPANLRAREIIRSGAIGEVTEVNSKFLIQIPFISNNDIRYNVNGTQSHLAGGGFMDTGVYASNGARFLADLNFQECIQAEARERFPKVDEFMGADVVFKNSSVKGHVESSMTLPFPYLPSISVHLTGTKGTLTMTNFVAPMLYHAITVTSNETGKTTTEKDYGKDGLGRSTYEYQLENFVKCVREQKEGGPARTVAGVVDDFVNTMQMLDGVYEKSGLGKRVGAGMN